MWWNGRCAPNTSAATLIMTIWTKTTEECFQHLVESIPRIIKAVLKSEVQPFTSKVYLIKWLLKPIWKYLLLKFLFEEDNRIHVKLMASHVHLCIQSTVKHFRKCVGLRAACLTGEIVILQWSDGFAHLCPTWKTIPSFGRGINPQSQIENGLDCYYTRLWPTSPTPSHRLELICFELYVELSS